MSNVGLEGGYPILARIGVPNEAGAARSVILSEAKDLLFAGCPHLRQVAHVCGAAGGADVGLLPRKSLEPNVGLASPNVGLPNSGTL